MPELPEVETIRRQLEPQLTGRTISEVEVIDERWSRPLAPQQVEERVRGRRIDALERRGKYFVTRLEGGVILVMHLRMTGNLTLAEPGGEEPRFLRVRFLLDDGRELRFTDARRFGEGFVVDESELEARFAGKLGVEPLSEDFTPELLGELAAGRKAPLKSFLLDQARVAGIGNIYADEALFRARLHPLSPAGSMREPHLEALHEGIIDALLTGIEWGGASIDDYRDASGAEGQMQDEFLVHTREGKPCVNCGTPIRRIVVSGRSTYFCPQDQVRLRRRRATKKRARP